MNFIFFTKTNLSEPPRIRHQLAFLLTAYGHNVYFFQRPKFPFSRLRHDVFRYESILPLNSMQLIHHQLRFLPFFSFLNSLVELSSIKNVLNTFNIDSPIIINFNYDYFFIRKLFPTNRIITFINDDFPYQAKCFNTSSITHIQSLTCDNSDLVFCVSSVLATKISTSSPVHVFPPWSTSRFMTSFNKNKRHVLFWGYIDNRINFSLVEEIISSCPEFLFNFCGPIEKTVSSNIMHLSKYPNFIFHQSNDLDNLDFLNNVLAAFLPYRSDLPEIDSIVIPNRAFSFLSHGIPLIYSGAKNFLRATFTFPFDSSSSFKKAINSSNNTNLNDDISSFLNMNSADARYDYLMDVIGGLDV